MTCMKEKIQIKTLSITLVFLFTMASCKTANRSGEDHRPFILQPNNLSSFSDLQPSAICEDPMGSVSNQATMVDKSFVIHTERPLLEDGYCKVFVYGKTDPELRYLSTKKSGALSLYYESRHLRMKTDPMAIELWKLVEGKGRAPAKILVTIADLNGQATEARLKCSELSTAVAKTRTQANLVEFEVEASILAPAATTLSNCVVTGSIAQSPFATQNLPTFNPSWGGQSQVSVALKKNTLPLTNPKYLGLSPETLKNILPGIWTFKNLDGSCLNLEFKVASTNFSYRYFRAEATSCRQIPAELPFKDALILNREDEIPTGLRGKIGSNNFLVQFKRAGEESSWSLMTLGPNKLLKLGNNILNPTDLLKISESDPYLKN